MDYKEITQLIELIDDSNLSEFKLKDGDTEIRIRTDKYIDPKSVSKQSSMPVMQAAQPVAPQAPLQAESPSPSSTSTEDKEDNASGESSDDSSQYLEVKSPIVGTFYRSSSPDKPPFVKVGDTIEEGGIVCIVEAMKLFNEIESEVSGKIVKVLVEDATPVEFDQALFLVDPNA